MIKLIELDHCRIGGGTFVEYDGREYAVFRLTHDDVVVMENSCPHASGNLSGGEVCDGQVACPWHQWKFDVRTGVCVDSPAARAQVFKSEVRNDQHVWIQP